MIVLKEGVRLHGIRPEIVLAIVIAEGIWEEANETLVITSGIEGTHKHASLHYTGGAVNFRHAAGLSNRVAHNLAHALGADYDVVVEETSVHVEWQPKAPY